MDDTPSGAAEVIRRMARLASYLAHDFIGGPSTEPNVRAVVELSRAESASKAAAITLHHADGGEDRAAALLAHQRVVDLQSFGIRASSRSCEEVTLARVLQSISRHLVYLADREFLARHRDCCIRFELDLIRGDARVTLEGKPVDGPVSSLLNLGALRRASVAINIASSWKSCNPSLLRVGARIWSTVRTVNYAIHPLSGELRAPGPLLSESFLHELGADLRPLRTLRITDTAICDDPRAKHGLEDIRLVSVKDVVYAVGSAKTVEGERVRCTMVVARLDLPSATLREHRFIDSPYDEAVEKNWMPFERDGELHFVYTVHPLRVFRLVWQSPGTSGRLVPIGVVCETPISERQVRGGSALHPFRHGYLAVVHRKIPCGFWNVYAHRFAWFSKDFSVYRSSREFTFRNRVTEFCSSLLIDENTFLLGFGVNDEAALIDVYDPGLLAELDLEIP